MGGARGEVDGPRNVRDEPSFQPLWPRVCVFPPKQNSVGHQENSSLSHKALHGTALSPGSRLPIMGEIPPQGPWRWGCPPLRNAGFGVGTRVDGRWLALGFECLICPPC